MIQGIRYNFLWVKAILKTISVKRIFQYSKLFVAFKLSHIFKIHFTNMHPIYVSIEPTNICNLQCPECPTGNKSSIVQKGYISQSIFDAFVAEIHDKTWFLNLYFQGEPLLHANLLAMITQAHSKKMLTSISTNAHYITAENAEQLVQSGLTKIIVSLDGYNQETYQMYRKGGSFERVLQSLEFLMAAKRKYNSQFPLVELQCLLFKHTQDHRSEVKEIGKKYAVDFVAFKTAQFYDATNIHMLPNESLSRYKVVGNELFIKHTIKNKCWRMWSSVVISWQGNVLPCCFDKNHEFSLGNIAETSFSNILKSKNNYDFKKNVHTNRKSIKMCVNCSE